MDLKILRGLYSPEFVKPLILCFKLLNGCNINIFKNKYEKYWHTIMFPCVLLHYITMSLQLFRLISDTKNVVDLATTVLIFMFTTQAIIKVAIIMPKKEEIKEIVEELGAMWRTTDLTNIQIKRKNKVLKKISICQRVYYYSSMFGTCLYTLSPLLETLLRRFILKQDFEWLLPYPSSYPFDPTKTWFRFITLYIFQTYCMLKYIFAYLGCEFLMVALCSHLVAEFTILREDILHLKPSNNKEQRQKNQENFGEMKINHVIKRHQRLIDLSQRLDDIFNIINCVILLFTTIITCLFAFTAKVSSGGIVMFTNYYLAVMGTTMPTFILCYFSELLAKESTGIADSAYENSWYKGEASYQKSIRFIILRAQRPCCLTSLKYAPINLTSFSKVLQTTWSYFTLIICVYEDNSVN